MDIGALSSPYLNQTYVPFSSSPAPSGGGGGFEEILKKAQASADGGENGDASLAAKKAPVDKNDKLYQLCLELETFLVKNLIKGMRNTVTKTKLIDTGFAGEMYEDMLYNEYAKEFTKGANLGFAELAYRDMKGLR